jgi:hypothetical protein
MTEPTIAQLSAKLGRLERLTDRLVTEAHLAASRDKNEQTVLLDVAYRIRYILDTP